MRKEVRERLIEAARIRGNTLGAQYISSELYLGLDIKSKDDRKMFNEIINEITLYEMEHNRPMLGSIVLVKKRGKTYKGFFELCESQGMGDKTELEKDKEFIKKKRQEVYDFWRDDDNYYKYKKV